MVLVRSPKRGPWLRPTSPTHAAAHPGTAPAAAIKEAGEYLSGTAAEAAVGDKEVRRPTLSTTIVPSSERSSTALSGAGAGTKERAVFLTAAAAVAAHGGTASSATGKDQIDRGASFTGSFSPRCPLKVTSRLSQPCLRRSSSTTYGVGGCFFSEATTSHTNTISCRRPSPPTASCSNEPPPASASDSRPNDITAHGDCREVTTAAARDTPPLQMTHTSLPFSRSAARHLARVPPQTAPAATAAAVSAGAMSAAAINTAAAGHPPPLLRGGGGGGGRGSGIRGASSTTHRRFSRGNATTGEVFTSRKGDITTPQLQQTTLAVNNVSMPKRMRYAQRSPPRVTGGRSETLRTTIDTRVVVPSVPVCRKAPIATHAPIAAVMTERDSPIADQTTDTLGVASYSSAAPTTTASSRHDPPAKTAAPVDDVVDPATVAAACNAEPQDSVAHNHITLSTSAVTATPPVGAATPPVGAATTAVGAATAAVGAARATVSLAEAATAAPGRAPVRTIPVAAATAAPSVSPHVSVRQQKVPQVPQRIQAIELLQQLPATRSLHNYVQEATRATSATTDNHGNGAALRALFSTGTTVASESTGSTNPLESVTARSTTAKAPHGITTTVTPAATCVAADGSSPPIGPHPTRRGIAASSTSINSHSSVAQPPVRTSGAASTAAKAPAALDASVTTNPIEAPAIVTGASGGVVAHPPPRAATVSMRATPSLTTVASSSMGAARSNNSSNSNRDNLQQQLVLPRTAEELIREWGPTVENVTQRLCDIREEEKQVTQFIILEGRALRVLRQVTQALEQKRIQVAAVHARVAEHEAVQQRAHADSEKYFEIVHRQAEDAAGGQARLEKRLKDTQQKKERLFQLRRQLYEEMFTCALLRQKKVELGKQLLLLKNTSAARESRRNALFQLLQRITRLRLLQPVRGSALRAAIIPEGINSSESLFEERDFLLPEESVENETQLLLMQQHRKAHQADDMLKASQQSALKAEEQQPLRERGKDTLEDPHTYHHSRQQQKVWKRSGAHYSSSAPTVDKYHNNGATHLKQLQLQQQHRGNIHEKKNLSAEWSGLSLKTPAGQYVSKRIAASRGDTSPCRRPGPEPDVLSLCTEPSSSDGDDCCRRLIAAKTAGEPAIVTVDCSRRDNDSMVCKDVDTLWQLIEEAVGLPPE